MKRLTYKKLADSVIAINLQNGYTVVAMELFNRETMRYKLTYYIKDDTIDILELIEKLENEEVVATHKTIHSVILRRVAILLSNGFFDYYIKRYEYGQKCFDKGNDYFEEEMLNDKGKNDKS